MSSVKKQLSESEFEESNSKRTKLDVNEAPPKLDDKSTPDNDHGRSDDTAKVTGDNNNGTETKNAEPASGSGTVEAKDNGPTYWSSSEDGESEHNTDRQEFEERLRDPKVAESLRLVEDIQGQISKLNEQASEEILKVEQKFNGLRRPHFEKRNALLKDVPKFWLNTFLKHPIIGQLIEHPENEDCLLYMTNIEVEELEDIKSGYNLKFHFAENPYIKNDLIVREIRHLNEEVVIGNTEIEYKDTPQGRKLHDNVEKSILQQRRKVRSERIPVSFFAWLSEDCEQESDDIAEIIKDQIWPNPLEYFYTSFLDNYDAVNDSDDEDSDYEDSDEEGIENEMPGHPEDVIDEEFEGDEFDDGEFEGEEFDDEDDEDEDLDDEDGDDGE